MTGPEKQADSQRRDLEKRVDSERHFLLEIMGHSPYSEAWALWETPIASTVWVNEYSSIALNWDPCVLSSPPEVAVAKQGGSVKVSEEVADVELVLDR
jgi:hypothetical protein